MDIVQFDRIRGDANSFLGKVKVALGKIIDRRLQIGHDFSERSCDRHLVRC
jgi:uncharacterized protein YjbJ (UPF0337 family)